MPVSIAILPAIQTEATMATLSSISDFSRVHQKWIWLLLLGIAFIVLGVVSFVFAPAATLASVMVFGWIVIIGGIVEGVQSFYVRRWQGVFLHLIAGLLGILVGFLIVTHPIAGALAWTLLFAAFFTVLGILRVVGAILLKFPTWPWAVFDGIIGTLLGFLLWAEWPWSGFWFLGIALGIFLTMRGWSYVMLALALRKAQRLVQGVI
jgi:uncharacterized membrane protein HdeD (DUF308 family)